MPATNNRQTGSKAASAADKVLANPSSTKAEKAAAASALAQAPTKRKWSSRAVGRDGVLPTTQYFGSTNRSSEAQCWPPSSARPLDSLRRSQSRPTIVAVDPDAVIWK